MKTVAMEAFVAETEKWIEESIDHGESLTVQREGGSVVLMTIQDYKARGLHGHWPLPEGY